jgi:hypothetical protein
MTNTKCVTGSCNFLIYLFCALIFPALTWAQDNAVYNSSGTQTVHSKAFIDASVLQGQSDFYATIYNILQPSSYPSSGAVIDARGISTNMTCASGTPWFESSTGYVNKPSTILLPAGTITANTSWAGGPS